MVPIVKYVCQILANAKSQQIVVILNLLQTTGKSTSLSHSWSTSMVHKRKKHMQIPPVVQGGETAPESVDPTSANSTLANDQVSGQFKPWEQDLFV